MTSRPITDEQLLAYAAGDLPENEARRVEDFLASNEDAARTVAMYRLAATRIAGDDTVAPPVETLARARSIYDPQRFVAAGRGLAERLQEVIARLVYDSRLQTAAVRYADAGTRFQVSFETEDADIDLQAERIEPQPGAPTGERWRLTGQLTAESAPEAIDISLRRTDDTEPVLRTRTDDRAMFTIEIAPGRYELCLSSGSAEIVLPAIEIP